MKDTYGSRLGELVRAKRRVLGLTQVQLSEDAFGTSSKVRRISDLENGAVENPHPKTIDPILSVLKISEAELEECLQSSSLNPDLDRAYREARNLIDALAYQFEHRNPDASLAELDQYLRSKAIEWRELKSRLADIEALDVSFFEDRKQASDALAQGKFAEVDSILADLEERYQQEKTLAIVREQAEIRIARADACMINDSLETALIHYKQAARFLEPFDQREAVRLLQDNAHRIYEGSRRSFQPRYSVGIELLKEARQSDLATTEPELGAELSYQLSLICRNAVNLAKPNDRTKLIDDALEHARRSECYSADSGSPYQSAASKVSLANCLLELYRKGEDITNLEEAAAILRTAKIIAIEENEAEILLSHICNSLGGILMSLSQDSKENDAANMLDEAVQQFELSVTDAEQHQNFETWGAAKGNLGGALAVFADHFENDDPKRIFLLIRSISEYLAALETYPQTLFPDHFAEMHVRLGNTLFKTAQAVQDERSEIYMVRSISSLEAAAVASEKRNPRRWADCQTHLASVIASHGSLSIAEDPNADFEEAIRRLEAAKAVYSEHNDEDAADSCRRNIELLKRKLEEVLPE